MVLSGGYLEVGDTGRHRVSAGAVLFHQRFEAHHHHVDRYGAEVLVLEIAKVPTSPLAEVADADLIARLAEGDPHAAQAELFCQARAKPVSRDDWPDLLARDLATNPSICLRSWSSEFGLHPGSLSRGFQRAFGVSPAQYRLRQRALWAIRLLDEPIALAQIADAAGFSDQSHMSRTVKLITGSTTRSLK